MDGLVGYASSSEDEDEASKTDTLVNGTGDRADSQTLAPTGENSTSVDANARGPMVGPSMPTDLTAIHDYEEDLTQQLPPMSERDLLRFLTQPSHPVMTLPPEPTGSADPAVTAKLKRFLDLKSKGVHFNEDLASKSSFKNPGLFASLLEKADLPPEAQYASNLPSEIFSLDMLPPWAYKEALLKSQQTIAAELEAIKKAKSAAGQRSIDFTHAKHAESGSQHLTPTLQVKRKRP